MKSNLIKPMSEHYPNENAAWLKKEGVIIYPVYEVLKAEWYMEVDMTKRFPNKPKKKCIIRYANKPIGNRNILLAKQMKEPWEKTLEFWRKKIQNENRKEVQRPK